MVRLTKQEPLQPPYNATFDCCPLIAYTFISFRAFAIMPAYAREPMLFGPIIIRFFAVVDLS